MSYASSGVRVLCAGLLLGVVLILAGCYKETVRLETSRRIAMPSFMHHRLIQADPFMITVYERVREKNGDATVYIEGDGLAWAGRRTPSKNPTPNNPVALHLASRDLSPNVIYMARPCQYSGMVDPDEICPREFWTSQRLSQTVIVSMNAALEELKREFGINKFNLVGYSGGGGLAMILASRRKDVATIRTVAGNLDTEAFSSLHDVSLMVGSMNPRDIAAKVAKIPQRHFIGEWDKIVPPVIYDSYRAAAGETSCMRSSIVNEADHETGWVNKWPQLLDMPVDCNKQSRRSF